MYDELNYNTKLTSKESKKVMNIVNANKWNDFLIDGNLKEDVRDFISDTDLDPDIFETLAQRSGFIKKEVTITTTKHELGGRVDPENIKNESIINTITNIGEIDKIIDSCKNLDDPNSCTRIKTKNDDIYNIYENNDTIYVIECNYESISGKELRYLNTIKDIKYTVDVDIDIDIHNDDLSVIHGIGSRTNHFDNVLEFLEHNAKREYESISYKKGFSGQNPSSYARKNLNEKIDIRNANKEIINEQTINNC